MALVKCANCGNMVSTSANFCPNCGKPIEKTIICEECGSEIPASAEICPNCGCPTSNANETSNYVHSEETPQSHEYDDYPRNNSKRIYYVIGGAIMLVLLIVGIIFHSSSLQRNKDYSEEPLDVVIAAANKGVPNAQFSLGLAYYEGIGVEQDYAEAMQWFRKATEQNHIKAQYYLGLCYYYGHGIQQDKKEGLKLCRTAAENGDDQGQCFLASYYSELEDYAESLKWWMKAAEQGNHWGQCGVGYSYMFGWGTSQNFVEAFKWFKKAAEQGDDWAMYEIGMCYAKGTGVEQNSSEALKWLSEASERGNEEAIKFLNSIKGEKSKVDYIGNYAIYPQLEEHQYDISIEENNVSVLSNWEPLGVIRTNGVWKYNASNRMIEIKLDEAIKIYFGNPPTEQWVRLLYVRNDTIARTPQYIINKDSKQCSTLSLYDEP